MKTYTTEQKRDLCEAMRELMSKYDEFKAKWEEQFGTAFGFNGWFSDKCGLSK